MKILDYCNGNDGADKPIQRNDMYLRSVGRGKNARYLLSSHFTEKVEWVSLEKDEEGNPLVIREPSEVTLQ